LVRIRRGPGGAELARPASTITLADVWTAMRRPNLPLLPTHRGPQRGTDPLGLRVPGMLRGVLDQAETAMERQLAEVTLEQLRDTLAAA
jgi:DNA-binding IscR family transcriptional regulator